MFPLMVTQLHLLISSFYPQGKSKWTAFAYISFICAFAFIVSGNVVNEVRVVGDHVYTEYGISIIVLIIGPVILAIRNLYILSGRLRNNTDPAVRNQLVALIMVIVVLSFFTIFAVLPWGRQYPIPHLGNLFTALIISYAVLRHHLIDIKIVVRNGTAWFSLAIFGLLFYYSSLTILHNILNFQMDASASIIATLIS
jgi:hypothetical protein